MTTPVFEPSALHMNPVVDFVSKLTDDFGLTVVNDLGTRVELDQFTTVDIKHKTYMVEGKYTPFQVSLLDLVLRREGSIAMIITPRRDARQCAITAYGPRWQFVATSCTPPTCMSCKEWASRCSMH